MDNTLHPGGIHIHCQRRSFSLYHLSWIFCGSRKYRVSFVTSSSVEAKRKVVGWSSFLLVRKRSGFQTHCYSTWSYFVTAFISFWFPPKDLSGIEIRYVISTNEVYVECVPILRRHNGEGPPGGKISPRTHFSGNHGALGREQ